jgi:5-methylcytosine-specific restriction endonuclease McrA
MADDDLSIQNPGEQLQRLLSRLYPFTTTRTCFTESLDDALIAEGDFAKLVYDSCINYMVRRLITAAEFLRREYDNPSFPAGTYIVEIRRYLQDFTHIPHRKIELIVAILLECLQARRQKPSDRTKTAIRRQAQRKGLYCYICGCTLEYGREGMPNSVEVEHVWPRKMGGKSEEPNLRVACQTCNQTKGDHIDGTDYHYEEACLVSDEADPDFRTELKRDYRVALLAKSESACANCGKPASQVGELAFMRRNPGDNWHFLNIDVYCSECRRRLQS